MNRGEDHTIIALLCPDGLIVRYERHDPPQIGIGKSDRCIAELLPIISDGLISVRSNDAAVVPPPGGMIMNFFAGHPESKDTKALFSSQVRLFLSLDEPLKRPPVHERPYHVSFANRLEIVLDCESLPDGGAVRNRPSFLMASEARFPFAWECIEVFPHLRISEWNENNTASWANSEISRVVIERRRSQDAVAKLDPTVETRRRKSDLLRRFRELLDARPAKEEVLQQFLNQNLELLCPNATKVWPKLRLGAHVTDFVFQNADGEYVLVELEQSETHLFTKAGRPAASLAQASKQVLDWWRYLEDNLSSVQRELGLIGISTNPQSMIVIGRTSSLRENDRRRLSTMLNQTPKIRVLTYDDLYENARAGIENLLGPIDRQPPGTQIYCYDRQLQNAHENL